MRRLRSLALLVLLLGLGLVPSSLAGGSPLTERERLKRFEQVWNLVRDEYYDPGYDGHDWVGIGNRYRERLATIRSDEELHGLLSEMVAQLEDTHTYYAPPAEDKGGARPTLGLGIDEVEGQLVVVSVEEASEAARQGIRPGMVLRTLDGLDIQERARKLDARIPTLFGLSSERILVTNRLKFLLDGPADQEVILGLSDLSGQPLEVRLRRSSIPKPEASIEARRLSPDLGYVRWLTWDPALAARRRADLAALGDTRSLVLDLRGNGGGDPQIAVDLLACFFPKATPWGRFQGRRPPPKIRTSACPSAYTGSLAVLTDRVTGSTSEIFANLIQETGRGRLVGQQSSGSVLYHHLFKVRGGGIFWCSRWDYISPRGRHLDRVGVQPDLPVNRTITAIRQGRDEVLEAAKEMLGSSPATPAGR